MATTETRKQSKLSPFSEEQMELLQKMLQKSFQNILIPDGIEFVAQKVTS